MPVSKDTNTHAKELAGITAAKLIQPDMLVGLGTGSTATHFIRALSQRCRDGLQIRCVATSTGSWDLGNSLGLPMIDIQGITNVDITVDGADEIDPAKNIAKVANERGVETLPEFFSEKLAGEIAAKYGKAKVMIGNNVVAHIDNHHDLVKGVSALLANDGVFMFEAPYIVDMFENYTFDTIYHEHLSYLSVRPLVNLFKQFGMELFDVKVFPVQGNSIRGYAGKSGQHEISPRVAELLQKEKLMKLDKLETYLKLASDIKEMNQKVITVLRELKAKGKRIAGYGAPAKGNTLLSYFGIGPDILDYATEALPSKIGFYTPGTHIPVVNIEDARKNPPDYFLLLAWNYKDVILNKEESLRQKGVKFIMPVGKIEIL